MLLRNKTGEEWISLGGSQRGDFAFARDLIITAGRTLVGRGFFFGLPLGDNELVALESAECGIDGATGQAGHLHDIEAEAVAEAECLEDESRAMGESRGTHKLCSMLSRSSVLHRVTIMLELKNVSKSYRSIPAVEDVSFVLKEGEVLGYLGPNGSGKSTTVKMVIGLIQPTKGKVLFEGRSIHDDLASYRAQLGYVPEEAQVYTHLSGLEYLQLIGRLRGMQESLIERKARELLQLLSLEAAQYSALSDYSKGMKQRVLIVAALLHDPKLIVFDEPLSGLDAVSARLFKDLLVLLAREGKAILYISHVLEVVERVCNRVIVLAKGKVVADAAPRELTQLMELPTLESVFAQLVQQTDTEQVAREMVDTMKVQHA